MASKKGEDNFNALGSIFDFLFVEAKKPPDKRRPVRPTKMNASSALGEAVVGAISSPVGASVDAIADEMNEALAINLYTTKFDAFGKIEIKTNNILDYLRDPVGTVDKSIGKAKAIRKSNRAMFLSSTMKDFAATAWAKKYANEEVQRAIYGGVLADEYESLRKGKKKDLEKQEKYRLRKAIGASQGRSETAWAEGEQFAFMIDRTAKLAERFGENLSPGELSSIGKYRELESKNIQNQIEELGDSQDEAILKKKEILEKAKFVIADKRVNKIAKNYRDAEREIKKLERKYRRSKDDYDKDYYQKQISALENRVVGYEKDLEKYASFKNKRDINWLGMQESFWGGIAQWEGYLNSIKMHHGANMAESMLKGDFFDNGKNKVFCPTKGVKLKFDGGFDLQYMIAADSKNSLMKAWNGMGESLYYMTPRSIVRTFFVNGEGFAHRMHRRYSNLSKRHGFNALGDQEIQKLLTAFLKDAGDGWKAEFEKELGGKLSKEALERIIRLTENSELLRRAFRTASAPARLISKMNAFFVAKTQGIRVKFADALIRTKLFNKALLESWKKTGGLSVLMKAITTVFGLGTGPVGTLISGLLTTFLVDRVLKFGAYMLNVFKYAALGVIAFFGCLIFFATGSQSKFNKNNYVYSTVPPGTVWQCALYNPIEVDPDNPDYPWGPTIIPPPSNEECIIDTPSPKCTQGWVGDDLFSHGSIKSLMPIDLAAGTALQYVYAPQFCDSGDCRITQVGQIICPTDGKYAGGAIIFEASTGSVTYTFRMYHVKPLASVNQKLSGGEPVAAVQFMPEIPVDGKCWTAAHIHFEAKQNGTPVNPLELLRGFNCSVIEEDCP